VSGRGDAGESLQERVGWRVEELVGDAEDSAFADCFEVVPVSLGDDSLKGDARAGTTPGEEEDIRICRGDLFGGGVGAGSADVMATCGSDQFGDPGLGVDEGLSPLFAIDTGRVGALSATAARSFNGKLHLGDEGFAFGLRVNDGGDEAYVFVDVGEAVRGKSEDWEAGFENRGEGLHTVGDAGDHQVGFGRENLVGVCGPAVVEDV
jgi:hypothetical protein